jgi:hypothetical protein
MKRDAARVSDFSKPVEMYIIKDELKRKIKQKNLTKTQISDFFLREHQATLE